MEQERKIITCLMKDDITSLLLAYRKLASMNCDIIGIQTAYDRKNQRFVITQELTKHFNRLACIGPVPVYEEYVTMANFPHDIDLDTYVGNTIHIDILDHLKTHHLDDIFPKQSTDYNPKLQIEKELFDAAVDNINHDRLNVVINVFDPQHDSDFSLIYDVIYCLNFLQKEFDVPITVYNAGLIHNDFASRVHKAVYDELESIDNLEIVNILDNNLSQQIAYMLYCDLVLSGSYGIGFLAYMLRVPSCIIFPYNVSYLMGKTTDRTRNTSLWYLETSDEDILSNLESVAQITRRAYDRNRNSNIQ